MKKLVLLFVVFATALSCKKETNQNAEEVQPIAKNIAATEIQLIQFHTENRCITCNNIEKLSKETIQGNDKISFVIYNLDDKKNEVLAEQFQATGTSLFLYNTTTKSTKDLTEMAFMHAKTEGDEFKAKLQNEILAFK